MCSYLGMSGTRFLRAAGLGLGLCLLFLAEGCYTLDFRLFPVSPPDHVRPFTVTVLTTGYCDCGHCCGWKRNWYGRAVYASGPQKGRPKKIGVTASGTSTRRGTLAADTKRYPFGTVFYLPGYGYGRVEDRGGRIQANHIDLFFPSHSAALRWGKRNVKATVWLPSKKR